MATTEVLQQEEEKSTYISGHVDNIEDSGLTKATAALEASEQGQGITGYETLSLWQTVKVFKMASFICFVMAFSAATDGYQIGLNGGIIANDGFAKQFATETTADGEPFLASPILSGWSSIMSVGQMIGQISVTFISAPYGRKTAMYWYWFVLVCSVICESVAKSWQVWLVGKLLAGIGVGSLQVTIPVYITEVAPVRIRGGLLMAYSLWFAIGVFFAPVALQVMSKTDPGNFRTPIFTQWGQLALMLSIYVFIPESPAWLAGWGKETRAKKELLKINRGVKDYNVDQQYNLLVLTIEHERAVAKEQNKEKWTAIFKGVNGFRTIAAVWALQSGNFLGATLFSTFGAYFFEQAGLDDPFLITSITTAIGLVTILFMILSSDRWGRRWIPCYGQAIAWFSCLAIGIIGVCPQVGATTYLFIFFACLWNVGFTLNGAAGWAALGEMSSQRLRAHTAGFGAGLGCIIGIIMNVLTPYMVNTNQWNWGLKTGWFYVGVGLPFAVGVWFVVPETKSRSAAELDELFERKIRPWRFHKTETATERVLKLQQQERNN